MDEWFTVSCEPKKEPDGGALLTTQQPQDKFGYHFLRELARTKHVVAACDQDGQVVRADVSFGDELSRSLTARVWVCGLHNR